MDAEARLRKDLLRILPSVAESGWHVFMNSKFNSFNFPNHALDQDAEKLYETSKFCIDTREALNLPTAGTVGKLFVLACEENASTNPQRRGPRKLAAALLERLNNSESS